MEKAEQQKPTETSEPSSVQQILAMSEISIHVDTYDDIFSDFDPRPYTQRSISVDFLDETKRAIRDKADGQLTLRVLAPTKIRNTQQETMIRKRLREHFKKHADQLIVERRSLIRKGILVTILGFSFAGAGAVISQYMAETLLTTFLIVLLEPAGWFTLWHGLDMAIFDPKTKDPEISYYTKMSEAELLFESY